MSDNSPKKRHEFALTAFILGVVSIVIPILVPCAIVALVLGSIAIHQINKDPEHLGGMGLAIAGVAAAGTSIFYLILVLIAIIIPLLIGDDNGTEVEQIQVHVRLVQQIKTYYIKSAFALLIDSNKLVETDYSRRDRQLRWVGRYGLPYKVAPGVSNVVCGVWFLYRTSSFLFVRYTGPHENCRGSPAGCPHVWLMPTLLLNRPSGSLSL